MGNYRTEAEVTNKQQEWDRLNKMWQEDHRRRINFFREVDEQLHENPQCQPGERHTLRQDAELTEMPKRLASIATGTAVALLRTLAAYFVTWQRKAACSSNVTVAIVAARVPLQ